MADKTRLFHSVGALPAIAVADPLPPLFDQLLVPADHPIALFPVRLETRFFAQADGSSELRVRIYPDRVQIDSHEPELLSEERDWGTRYWTLDWRAGDDDTARSAAWRQLADRFGPTRAAYIAQRLRPTNGEQRPKKALAASARLPSAPAFPAITIPRTAGTQAWRSAPKARLMPDRWNAVLHSGGRPVIAVAGHDVAPDPAVGPTPTTAKPDAVPEGQTALDAGMRWMVDFEQAEKCGMALRIAVPRTVLDAGIENLFVFGVSANAKPADTAARLADLLDAQHYTDGLEFLRTGTATNNTADQRAGWESGDPGQAKSYANEVLADPAALVPESNALRVGRLLGLPAARIADVLGRIGQAAERHETGMGAMNTALWAMGWGYFLSNLVGLDGTGLSADVLDWVRSRFIGTVRAAGACPVLRCGRQPYGVLPVSSLDLWKPRAADAPSTAREAALQALLLRLRDAIWRPQLPQVARVGQSASPNPDGDLIEVMRIDGLSSGYQCRSLAGRHYFQHLRAFMGEDLAANGFLQLQDAMATPLLQKMGYAWRPRLAQATFADSAPDVTAPLVQEGEISRATRLQPDYIAALLSAPTVQAVVDTSPASLLHVLLRHAMLREFADATAAIATPPGTNPSALLRDAELVDLVPGGRTLTFVRQLDQAIAGITGDHTIRQFLEAPDNAKAPALKRLGQWRDSVAWLQGLSTAELELLMQGTLDLSTQRLDAWISSFAHDRLRTMRDTAPEGAYSGGYGWVENLVPAAAVPVVTPPPGEAAPLQAAAGDSGFIHAPSATHAAGAALLRNAHLGATGTPGADSPFAMNLTSRRARDATTLLDGMREGQPLGALLGYRFERGLHEVTLRNIGRGSGPLVDRLLPRLRALAPLVPPHPQDATLPAGALPSGAVVDGLALHDLHRDQPAAVTAGLREAGVDASDPGATDAEIAVVEQEFVRLADLVDALSDALTAEAAYQVARGNPSRLAATLAAVSRGDAPPPELEVTRTPRTGTALTHRVLVLLGGEQPVPMPGWTATSPRANAEPLLDAWAAGLLGDPHRVRCTVERYDPDTGAARDVRTFKLADLSLAPLDVVYGVDATSAPTPGDALTELEQRVLFQARRMTGGFGAAGIHVRIRHARPANLAVDELTLSDVMEQARALRRLLAGARGAESEDLNPPERIDRGAMDLAELLARATAAETALANAHDVLDHLAKSSTPAADALRNGLLALGAFGVGSALPVAAVGADAAARAALLVQAAAAMKESRARLDEGTRLRAAPASNVDRTRRDQLIDRLRAVFGPGFVAVPRFRCGGAGADLAKSLAASTAVQGGEPTPVYTWFTRSERVRPALAKLGACLRGAEVLQTGDRLHLTVAQAPFVKGERWVALPPAAGRSVPAGKLSLVVQASAPPDPSRPLAGLMIDEWVEVVPSREETTAIAFPFDPPGSVAPQCILLAVPPDPDQPWKVGTLLRVLAETLDLTKLRGVDTELLTETSQYLPALYLALNAKNATVSTDPASLLR